MATMFRVTIPDDDGSVTVSTGVVAFSTCAATELAVIVGSSVAKERLGSEFQAFLRRWADTPKSANGSVGGTNRLTYVTAPTEAGEAVAAATPAEATAPTETQWGVVLGATAATYLDRGVVIREAIERCIKAFVPQLGL